MAQIGQVVRQIGGKMNTEFIRHVFVFQNKHEHFPYKSWPLEKCSPVLYLPRLLLFLWRLIFEDINRKKFLQSIYF